VHSAHRRGRPGGAWSAGAMTWCQTEDFGAAVHTGVWSAHHLNRLWLRCPACRRVADAGAADTCDCGQRLPEAPPYW
jgi:hypothetical protein